MRQERQGAEKKPPMQVSQKKPLERLKEARMRKNRARRMRRILLGSLSPSRIRTTNVMVKEGKLLNRNSISKALSYTIAVLVLGALGINSIVKVSRSSSDRAYGIVEHWLFGKPLIEVLAPPFSENYHRWKAASEAANTVADLIREFGSRDLVSNPALEDRRARAQLLSQEAYEKASAISSEYLHASNPELPDVYLSHFVPAVDLWSQGFEFNDLQLVKAGMSNYNAFLTWIQSKKDSDFKSIR